MSLDFLFLLSLFLKTPFMCLCLVYHLAISPGHLFMLEKTFLGQLANAKYRLYVTF